MGICVSPNALVWPKLWSVVETILKETLIMRISCALVSCFFTAIFHCFFAPSELPEDAASPLRCVLGDQGAVKHLAWPQEER